MDRRSVTSMSEVDDMVTVSLNEVLATRSRFLEEREFWALCRECCLTLEYVHDCHDLFQSLCISPDTVAFDPDGNVCFLDLDMDPEPLYVAPEYDESGSSFKTHLFSLGMTLLFATEYNSESYDPKAQLSDTLTDLLSGLTSDEADLRPDLDTVIDICDKALDGELSQIICLNIVGLKGSESPAHHISDKRSNSSLQQVTDELTAYLESQSGLVQSPTNHTAIIPPNHNGSNDGKRGAKDMSSARDQNANHTSKSIKLNSCSKNSGVPPSIRDLIKDASPDEDEMLACQDDTNPTPPRRTRKRQGIMLGDLLRSLNRYLGENELWALCRECILCLQRKKKHLPAYISPETVMVCESGSITFKAIPEEKPLEVVYMAAELQQKGTLNEKTCLYGLGVTLRKAAGVTLNSSQLNITDGEALEILINSFLQSSPDRRPSLDTAYEMCEEYEKVNEGTSRETCVQVYREALESAVASKASISNAENHHDAQKSYKDSSNSWDSSELEQNQLSSDNTLSIAQGDTTEAEESIDELPSDIIEDETVVSAASAFKPLPSTGKKEDPSLSSAFKILPQKTASSSRNERIPSAFSSPATHFKPIILQESTAQEKSLSEAHVGNHGKSEVDVVTKLRELKHNLSKKRGPLEASPKAGSHLNTQDKASFNAPIHDKTESSNPSELGSYIKLLKNQGQIPNTDELASAIAKYLHQEMSDPQNAKYSQKDERSKAEVRSNNTASFQPTFQHKAHSQHQSPAFHKDDKNRVSIPSFYSAPSTQVQNRTLQSSHPSLPYVMSSAQPTIQGSTGPISSAQPYISSTPHSGTSPSVQYSIPMSGVSVPAPNIPQVQFTLMQDPVTGLMQMVPISYLPFPQQHLGCLPNTNPNASNTFTSPSSSRVGELAGITIPTSHHAFPNNSNQMAPHTASHNMTHMTGEGRHFNSAHSYAGKPPSHANPTNLRHDHGGELNQRETLQREDDNHSRSSSPSPSKDSGICVTQQSYQYKENLMDKLLSSGHLNRQQILSRVVGIIREEFAEDGIFDSGVEDLAIVREKYSNLIWTQEVLMILHEVITDSRLSRGALPQNDHQPNNFTHQRFEDGVIDVSHQHPSQQQSQQMHDQLDRNQNRQMPQRNQRQNMAHAPSKNQHFNRPRSELARAMMSSASDSTDSEATEKRRSYKKRYNLNKGKSSSLHNVAHQDNFESGPNQSFISKTYSPPMLFNSKPSDNSNNPRGNPSVFSKDYFSTSTTASNKADQPDQLHLQPNGMANRNAREGLPPPHSLPTDFYSNSHDASGSLPRSKIKQSGSLSSQHIYKQNQFGMNQGQQFSLLPSKTSQNRSSPHLLNVHNQSGSSPSVSQRSEHSLSPVPNQQSKYVPSHNVRSPSSSSTCQPPSSSNVSKPPGPLAGDHSIHSRPGKGLQDNFTPPKHENKIALFPSNSKYGYDNKDELDNSSDVDFNSSAEMRRLAAEKPELYDRRTPSLATPVDKNFSGRSSSHLLNTSRDSIIPIPSYKNDGRNTAGKVNPLHSSSSNAISEGKVNKRRENAYKRSMSAVYSLDTGVKVSDKSKEFSHHQRRGSDSSIDLPAINSVLLPYVKKGQVVYHSAMIQLSLTPEVDHFIHSIDEENKADIENQLASLSQEINMQWKQRRKTQRFYKRLSEQNSKASKGDQNVSDQMLKDMAEMTRKLAFLNLCRTHLQMLLAELNGLDVCYLHSLSVCDGQNHLILDPVMENKYLQFRTFNTKEAGSMSILQAGTPKGLLSYLYTSSALSDGYIHQFLLCFRYILTADQMFAFIVDKWRSAQRSKIRDKNILRIQYRSLDLLQFWIEGYFSIDFAGNTQLTKRLGEFIQEQTSANMPGAQELYSLYAACRLRENSELMLMTEMEEDDENDNTYFMHIANPKQSKAERQMEWESFRSLLKRSRSDKSLNSSGGMSRQKGSDSKATAMLSGPTSTTQFSLSDVEVHSLAEQLTLIEQDLFRKCHPLHFLNSQFHGVGVALSMSGLRTPSMSRKIESSDAKRGLFIGDPSIESNVVSMISHAQELAHWVSAEILSCGSGKYQTSVIQKFISVAHMCLEVRNYATALSIFEGLDNLVVKQLPVWKNVSSKCIAFMEEVVDAKMKHKSEAMWLTRAKDFHIYPTIPCALIAALHLQQIEIGGFTLANGMFKWDKMRSISETVDQLRIFRDHEYGFHADPGLQRMLQRRLSEFSDQDLHAVASTHENNFRRHSSSSSLSGTLKKFKDKIQQKKK